jgi:large subunit ribosomal protein L11
MSVPNKAPKRVVLSFGITIGAGKATPAPPVGTALGPKGLNIPLFCTQFNDLTKNFKVGAPIPVVVSVHPDKSFTLTIKTPLTSYLIKENAEPVLAKGSKNPGKEIVAKIRQSKLAEIAKTKINELTASSLEAALQTVKGTALSMGIEVIED